MALISYLGRNIGELLSTEPCSGWHVVRSVEEEPRLEIWYEFEGHGVEVICDADERIQAIFVHRGDGESLFDLPFAMTRKQVVERFGSPSRSGGPTRLPRIGDRGAWDRFALPEGVIHFHYSTANDEIDTVTLMLAGVVP